MSTRPIKRALISVYDKTGLVELATTLSSAGVEIVSTGSTAATISAQGIPVTQVADLTDFPEMLDGRVKTLHPRVHAGILADTRVPDHLEQLVDNGISPFELVIVNLYPFSDTVASGASPDECVEQIDIGGPSMVRAAAKNHPSVAVVVSPQRYEQVAQAAQAGGFTLEQRKALAAEAFRHTASYDVAVATWMGEVVAPEGRREVPGLGRRRVGESGDIALWRESAPSGRAIRRYSRVARDRSGRATTRQRNVLQQLR